MEALVAAALERDKRAIGQLISVFEDTRSGSSGRRATVLATLSEAGRNSPGFFHGITGTPGAGKSSLIGCVAERIVEAGAGSVAVVAVDPASEASGGALLGDRTRVRFPTTELRLFFRSQSSNRALGGISRTTYQVCRLLGRLFDHVLIETVGIGQSEIEVQYVADRIYLVLQPLGGDQIQFMKAGIMEVPDVFIMNKSDEEQAASRSFHALKASLAYARPGSDPDVPVLRTSTRTGEGLAELVDRMISAGPAVARRDPAAKEGYFFATWVRDEFGRRGTELLLSSGGLTDPAAAGRLYVTDHGGFDRAQHSFAAGTPWQSRSAGD